ncbi:MAG: class I SAM-dependent methyltransferase [Gammaproteobacteria bacterium]
MYQFLHDIARRPEPFSRYTAKELWTRPYLARQMLSFHLNQDTDLASRRFEAIDQVVDWIDAQLSLSGKRVCDLGCGPGLYTLRFSARGADVTGIDFSANSLDYARLKAREEQQSIRYIDADYLSDELPAGFDIVTLHNMLKPGGHIVLDVAGVASMAGKQDMCIIEDRFMNGFWAAGNYVGIQRSFIYPEQQISLDRYLIVEPDETWEIFNWFQYFSADSIELELKNAGFVINQMVADLNGEPLKPESNLIAVIASAG